MTYRTLTAIVAYLLLYRGLCIFLERGERRDDFTLRDSEKDQVSFAEVTISFLFFLHLTSFNLFF